MNHCVGQQLLVHWYATSKTVLSIRGIYTQVTHKLFIITDSIYLVNSLIFLINTCYNYLQIAGLTNIVYYAAAVKDHLCMARILLVVVFIQNCFYSCNSKNVPVLIEYKF